MKYSIYINIFKTKVTISASLFECSFAPISEISSADKFLLADFDEVRERMQKQEGTFQDFLIAVRWRNMMIMLTVQATPQITNCERVNVPEKG